MTKKDEAKGEKLPRTEAPLSAETTAGEKRREERDVDY